MVLNGSRIVLALIVLGAFFLVQRKQRRVSDTYMERFKARQTARFGSQTSGQEEEPGGEFDLVNRTEGAGQDEEIDEATRANVDGRDEPKA